MKYFLRMLAMVFAISVQAAPAMADSDSRDHNKEYKKDHKSDDRSDDRSRDRRDHASKDAKVNHHAAQSEARSRNATMERMMRAKERRERPTSR